MSDLLNSIEELMLELEEENKTVAVIPGAFKPPHLGHLQMVREYAQHADQVVVLVSSPLRGSRQVGGRPISAQQSESIWEMLLAEEGLDNVIVEISPELTPTNAAYEYIGENGPLQPGTNVILGSSQGDSFKYWGDAGGYVKEGVVLQSPSETAIQPAVMESGQPYRAADLREILDEGGNADEFFGEGRTASVYSILGLKEMSAMSGGAIQGSVASADEEERNTLTREQNTKHPPYNELYLYKEVLRLLMKEGIIK